MKQFTIRWLLLVLLLGYGLNSYAQEVKAPTKESSTLFRKNAIVVNIGWFLALNRFNGYYERMLKQGMWNRNISSFAKVGVGTYADFGGDYTYMAAQYGLLTGIKTFHFEISGGLMYRFYEPSFEVIMAAGGTRDKVNEPPSRILPSGTIGLRLQKPGGKFMFRMGVGYPEGIYAGVGFTF